MLSLILFDMLVVVWAIVILR